MSIVISLSQLVTSTVVLSSIGSTKVTGARAAEEDLSWGKTHLGRCSALRMCCLRSRSGVEVMLFC